MKSNKLNIFFLHILVLYNYINSKDFYFENPKKEKNNINSFINSSITPNYFQFNENNEQNDDFERLKKIIIKRNITKENVQSEFLNSSYIYEFHFSNSVYESDLIVNFYSLDCQIIIEGNDKNDISINKIDNYEYDAFSVVIQNEKINSSFITIKPLMVSLEEKNIIRTYHLIINSFDKNNPQITFNEKMPTLIYFDTNLKKLKLSYKLNNLDELIIFSFFIKEKNRFEVKILDNELPNKIIAYKDNIIIDPKNISLKDNNIYITINKIDNKNCTMIVKVSGNNSPFYLQKNILN